MTRGNFAKAVIKGVGAKVTPRGRRALQAQMQVEGGSAKNNPFNTTLKTANSVSLPGNTAGVQQYKTAKEGIEATVRTLQFKGHGYERIIQHLRDDDPSWKVCVAVIESDWGTGEAVGAHDHPLILDVLSDINHDRKPNTLPLLEAKQIAS